MLHALQIQSNSSINFSIKVCFIYNNEIKIYNLLWSLFNTWLRMKTKLDLNSVRRWATQAVSTHDTSLSNKLATKFHVSRVTAAKALKQFVADGWLDSTGSTRPIYQLGRNREVVRSYPLPNIDEHIIWDHDFRSYFDLRTGKQPNHVATCENESRDSRHWQQQCQVE